MTKNNYGRREPQPPLTTHNIRIALQQSLTVLLCVNKHVVTAHLFNRNLRGNPVATKHYFVSDEPLLGELYSETNGWDLELLLQMVSSENLLEEQTA